MFQKAWIGIDIRIHRRIRGAWSIRTVLRIGSIGILGPKAVEDKCGVLRALRRIPVRMAEFRRPGKIQQIVVEVLLAGRLRQRRFCSLLLHNRFGGFVMTFGGRRRRRSAAFDQQKKSEKS